MKLTESERFGRYLCTMYYRGELKSSSTYTEQNKSKIAKAVEKALQKNTDEAQTWRMLFTGDLTKLNSGRRAGLMGGRAILDGSDGLDGELRSIDGGVLCVSEVALYHLVANNFMQLIS